MAVFGANIVSNTYVNGKGVILFDGDVTSIGDGAFSGCSGLTSITSLNTTPPTLSWRVFNGVPSTCPIYVHAASVDAYKAAAYWSERAAYIQAIPTE